MQVLKYKNIFLGVALLMVLASLATILINGFKQSIDFTGGAKVVFNTNLEVTETEIRNSLITNLNLKEEEIKLLKTGSTASSSTFTLTTRDLKEEDYPKLQTALKVNASTTVAVTEFAMTGPSISKEIVSKSIIGFILVALAIILFIWLIVSSRRKH